MVLEKGLISFNIIQPSLNEIADVLQEFLVIGSKRSLVAIDDLTIVSDNSDLPEVFVDISDALRNGTKLFDAIYYFSLPNAKRPKIMIMSERTAPESRDPIEIAKAVFFQTFMVLTRGSPSEDKDDTIGSKVPAFLKNVLGLTSSPSYYGALLASFDLQTIDWRFIKLFDFNSIGQEALNRFGLGVAGYRLLQPFMLYEPREGLSPERLSAVNFVRKIASMPADWSIHPVTRSSLFIQRFGSLNNNLNNLMLEVFTHDQLINMEVNKIIFKIPVENPKHTQFKLWRSTDSLNMIEPIFSKSN